MFFFHMLLFVLVLVICINIFAFEPNLHISQMTSLAYILLEDVIICTTKLHMYKYYANILENKSHPWPFIPFFVLKALY